MLNQNSEPHSQDLPLLRELGLKPFNAPSHKEVYVGEVDKEYCKVKIWVTCMPAQFFRFEIFTINEVLMYKFNTGSGDLTQYWKFVEMLTDGLIEFDYARQTGK